MTDPTQKSESQASIKSYKLNFTKVVVNEHELEAAILIESIIEDVFTANGLDREGRYKDSQAHEVLFTLGGNYCRFKAAVEFCNLVFADYGVFVNDSFSLPESKPDYTTMNDTLEILNGAAVFEMRVRIEDLMTGFLDLLSADLQSMPVDAYSAQYDVLKLMGVPTDFLDYLHNYKVKSHGFDEMFKVSDLVDDDDDDDDNTSEILDHMEEMGLNVEHVPEAKMLKPEKVNQIFGSQSIACDDEGKPLSSFSISVGGMPGRLIPAIETEGLRTVSKSLCVNPLVLADVKFPKTIEEIIKSREEKKD